ncbi:MAG: YggS family pyridoxal phosphate-dependent enzyme [Treponema sp.]|jgi:pyridoxal phosphate enzyme (YggS family)|nr:YggS family pyridoxal phosphate-dependent enzyme [Treponema sp.]
MTIGDRINRIEERIEAACRRCGRRREELRLMGVSKFHSLREVEEAFAGGIRLFGENRVQEGVKKFESLKALHPGPEIHLIGSLQRNKVLAAAAFFDCIQSVDRDPLLEELGKAAAERKEPLPILLEFHTGEASKSGYPDRESLFRAAEKALSFPALRLTGLMTMAPFTDSEGEIRASFRSLTEARRELEKRFPGYWSCLSMGMTNDFEIAIEEGSTLLRIGTAVFGERT